MVRVVPNRLGRSLGWGFRACDTASVWIRGEMREVRGRDIQPYSMSWSEDGTAIAQVDDVIVRHSRLDDRGRQLRALPQTRSDDTVEDVLRKPVRVHVDELRGEIRVSRGRRGPEANFDLADNSQIFGERSTGIHKDIVAQGERRLVLGA